MTGRELSEKLHYLGMEKGIRKLALEDKMATAEEIAVMSEIEVCDLIVEEYVVVFSEYENLGLVHKDKIGEYNKLIKLISR